MDSLFRRLRRGGERQVDPQLSIDGVGRDGTEIVVSGRARLPDGARLRCGLWLGHRDGPFEGITYAETDVRHGRFTCRFEPPTNWQGRVWSSVELRADADQPVDVQAHIGPRGEKLAYADTMGKTYAQVFSVATSDMIDGDASSR